MEYKSESNKHNKLIDKTSMMVIRGEVTRLWMVSTLQYTDDVLQTCIPKTYIMVLTNVTAIKIILKENVIDTCNGMLFKKSSSPEAI